MTDDNTICHLTLESNLDETTQLSCQPAEQHETLVVDFEKVKLINSTGIGIWINFITALIEQSNINKVIFRNARRMVINQINSVKDFLPAIGTVESFYLPLYCERCSKQFNQRLKTSELDVETVKNLDNLALEIDCDQFPDCRSEIEIDTLPGKYLAFLKPT